MTLLDIVLKEVLNNPGITSPAIRVTLTRRRSSICIALRKLYREGHIKPGELERNKTQGRPSRTWWPAKD